MTELETAIAATLRAEAEEAAMTTDTAREHDKLDARLDAADRSRRVRTWVVAGAAAVALVVAVVGVRALSANQDASPVQPSPSTSALPTVPYSTASLTPAMSLSLPPWTAYTSQGSSDPGSVMFSQADCAQLGGAAPCSADEDLKLRAISVRYFYRPDAGPVVSQDPSYADYLAHLDALASQGFVTETDRAVRVVGGRPATVMSWTVLRDAPGALACASAGQPAVDCFPIIAGRSARIAVVDHGAGTPPTVLYLSLNGGAGDRSERFAEFDAMLGTVQFG